MGKLTDRSLAPYVNLNSLIHVVNTGDFSQSPDGSSYKAPLSLLSPLFSGGTGGNSYWSASTGTNAIVMKYSNSLASGLNSIAEGSNTTAIGDYSHAEGDSTIASGITSHAEGWLTTAKGDYSHAEGQSTKAIGLYSHAGGKETIASGETSFVHGEDSIAIGKSTIVLGDNLTGTTANTVYVSKLVNKNNFTPTSSADSTGEDGSIAWDNTYFYYKANGSWLRLSGSTF
jgi:hypothetical protein